jgi:signal transduction histidine kinase
MNPESLAEVTETNRDTDRFFHYGLYRQIKFIEEGILIVSAVSHLLMLRLIPQPDMLLNRWTATVAFLIVYFILTRIDLIERPIRTRIIVLSLCVIAANGAYLVGNPTLVNPLFAILVARAVLFFEDRTARLTSWVVFLSMCVSSFVRYYNADHGQPLEIGSAVIILLPTFFYGTLWQGIVMAIVALLVRTIIDSQKQNLQMERLNREVASMAADLERSRIARDIHDGVGHSLTALSVQLEVARKLLSRDPKKSELALGEAEQMAKRCLRDVRNSVVLMRHDEEFDFLESLSTLINGIESSGSISIEKNVEIPELPTPTAYQIFRIIQESCTNCLRHSEANRIEVGIAPVEQELRITVRDNGKGFDADAKFDSFGLTGIRERVNDLNGRLAIDSGNGSGTTVTVVIPLSAKSDELIRYNVDANGMKA